MSKGILGCHPSSRFIFEQLREYLKSWPSLSGTKFINLDPRPVRARSFLVNAKIGDSDKQGTIEMTPFFFYFVSDHTWACI